MSLDMVHQTVDHFII